MASRFGAALAALCLALPAWAAPPLEAFFAWPELTRIRISPDGTHVAGISVRDDIWRVAVVELASMEVKNQISAQKREILDFWWIDDEQILISVSYDRGKEARLVRATARGGNVADLSQQLARAGAHPSAVDLLSVQPGRSDNVLVEISFRTQKDLAASSVARLNIRSGAFSVITGRGTRAYDWIVDPAGEPRYGEALVGDDFSYLYRSAGDLGPRHIEKLGDLDLDRENFEPLGFTRATEPVVIASRHAGDRFALYRYDPEQGVMGEALFAHPRYDVVVGPVLLRDGTLVGVSYLEDSWKVHWLDPAWRARAEKFERSFQGARVHIASWDDAQTRFVLLIEGDRRAPLYVLVDEKTRKVQTLASLHPKLRREELVEIQPVEYPARDGQTLNGYLLLPEGVKQPPLVVVVHEGPWSANAGILDRTGRAARSFSPTSQFLVSRGYAVFLPNFRGSVGYGLAFERAGYGKWGTLMQDDVSDGVRWLREQGRVSPERACIYGSGYGGLAATLALAKTPELYRCAIAYDGIYDLPGFSSQIAWYVYSEPIRRRIGRNGDALVEASPAHRVGGIRAPILLAHGDEGGAGWAWIEPQFDAMSDALEREGKPYEKLELKRDGQGLRRESNRLRFHAAAEKFLEEHLGAP